MTDVKLYLGDCLDVMREIPAGSVDAILTDLPYGTTACSWDVIIPFEPMWAAVKRVLKPRGVFVTTASQPFTSKLVMSNLEWFKYEWIWRKSKGFNFLHAKNSPIRRHENILVFSSGIIAHAEHSDNRMTYNAQGTHKTNKLWHRPKIYISEHRYDRPSDKLTRTITEEDFPDSIVEFGSEHNPPHPTQKPVALYTYLTLTYTNPGDTVLDFCCGSGTTGIACINTGRNFIGCDNSPEYYEIAKKRIEQAQRQMIMEI
jgi:site-specific DNA-methyltransferase (adenine-specific)